MITINDDKIQRTEALDPQQSFIIQAPAGSGKTELLIQRFLVLLNQVKTPEEILAITFTKKSANEMRVRVIKALKQASFEPEPESNHAKKTWQLAKQVLTRDKHFNWNLLDNPNQLSIQTIDSLCSYLTRQLPLLSHFGSQPAITEQPFFLYSEAVQEILTHVEENFTWSTAIAELLLHLDNDLNKLHHLLTHLLAKRDQWLPYIRLDANEVEIKTDLESYLNAINSEHLTNLTEIFPKEYIAELVSVARFAANNLDPLRADFNLLSLRELSSLPKDKKTWIGLAKLLLTKNHTWRKRVDSEIGFPALNSLKNADEKNLHTQQRKTFFDLIDTLSKHDTLYRSLKELFFLPDECYQSQQWKILQSLLTILKILPAQLRLTFQKYGQIDFIENSQAALLALGQNEQPTDLALALDYQIQHILIDEFQDTSISQYQLLEKLLAGWQNNDGRTLFVVGDPMQSIYRFREAEVGLFMRMYQQGINHICLTPLKLSVNFRSQQQIVNWNNQQFLQIFPKENNIANGAVAFTTSIAHTSDTDTAKINIIGLLNADEKMQAEKIVAYIKDNLATTEKAAILVRSRSHLSAIIPALQNAKIPYRAVDIDSLESKQHIQDLLSLTFALLHPMDRISWLAILRAPWCGISLKDLYLIANSNPMASIWQQLTSNEIIAKLSSDGQNRIKRIFSILKTKFAERERFNLRTWIENAWLQLGGPACLSHFEDILDINAYFNLLDEFGETNPLLNREKLKEKIAKLYAPPQHDEHVLQIMTIHTAKGLEFDTVILPHLERKMPYDDKALLAWLERPLANGMSCLLLSAIAGIGSTGDVLYDYITRQHKLKSDYETDRLLYVATTRAKKNLYLFFNAEKTSDGIQLNSGSFLSKLWPCIEKEKDKILYSSTVQTNQTEKISRTIKRLHLDWKNPYQAETSITALHRQQSGFKLAENKGRIIGTIVHKTLQHISELGENWWRTQTVKNQQEYFKNQFMQLGLSFADMGFALEFAQRAITNTLKDARGNWILKSHQDAKSEFSITVILNNKIENLIIDRTFVDETNTRWIIDYKTTTTENDVETFISNEIDKYNQQMQKYFLAMRTIDKRPIRLGLYFPMLSVWKEVDSIASNAEIE